LPQCSVAGKAEESFVVDQEVFASQLSAERFPFASGGDVTLPIRNVKYPLRPVIYSRHEARRGRSETPPQKHLHRGIAEALYMVEGKFTNEGEQY
jgi:hypothetical protein